MATCALVVHPVGAEAPAQTLFLESARRAADAGLALDTLGAPSILQTRFGPVGVADARDRRAGRRPRRAAVFRFSADRPALRVSGLACGAGARPSPPPDVPA